MILLPNGCRCSEIKVIPKDWNKAGASTKRKWKVYYRFYDASGKVKLENLKCGINKVKDLAQRRALVKALIEEETDKLQNQGYNPFYGTFSNATEFEYEIHPTTFFIDALREALEKLTLGRMTKKDMNYAIHAFELAARQLQIINMAICNISRKHIKALLEQCKKNNSQLSADRYNKYRAYLMMLFKELVEYETVTINPVRDISKQKVELKSRLVLTQEQREEINKHLVQVDYRFYLFTHIFFHSGARLEELVRLKRKDVNLKTQRFKITIKKGRASREEERTIKDIALPFWTEFMEGAQEDDFLFGVDFKPAPKPMIACTITRRWQKRVKKGLKIKIDLYSLKHSNTTETVDLLGEVAAAKHNGHTSIATNAKHYDVKGKERYHESIKSLANAFA